MPVTRSPAPRSRACRTCARSAHRMSTGRSKMCTTVHLMFAAERRYAILEMVRANGTVRLRDIAAQVGTSEVTVRRDLRMLEEEGLLDRRRGGAAVLGALSHEPTYSQKSHTAAQEKRQIAELAATLVEDGDAIVIGA